MRILVCGGRDFNDYKLVVKVLREYEDDTILIHGAATGADSLASKYAKERGWGILSFPVTPENWKRLGKAAGPIRNQKMLKEGKPDLVIAFPGGRGTENMVSQAKAAGIKIRRIDDDTKK